MNPAIQERVETARQLLGPYEILSQEAVESECARLGSILVQGRSEERYVQESRRDTQNDSPSVVRDWLRSLPVNLAESVTVLWPDLRSGLIAAYGGVVAAYDELWYPSSDDVWMSAVSGEWLLELDHEEVFRFFRRANPFM